MTRRRMRSIVLLIMSIVGLFCVTFVARSPLFVVRHVQVNGLTGLLPEEAAQVESSARVEPGTNLFSLRTGLLVSRLSAVPAVASVRVSRRLPGTVLVDLRARVAAAIVGVAGARWEVDRTGIAIRTARLNSKLPEIVASGAGPGAAGQPVDAPGLSGALAALLGSYGPRHAKPLPIAKIEVDQTADICLNMADSVAIHIGRTEQLETKLALVRRIYDERPDIGAEVESIDLRSPEAPSCLPRGTAKHAAESTARKQESAALQLGSPDAGSPRATSSNIQDSASISESATFANKPYRRHNSRTMRTSDNGEARESDGTR